MFLPNEKLSSGRGVVIYVRNGMSATPVLFKDNLFEESMFVEIRVKDRTFLIGCVYRSDAGSSVNNSALCSLFRKVASFSCSDFIIVGDFNYRSINWELGYVTGEDGKNSQKCFDTINDLFLAQHVRDPTRYRIGEQANVLDLVLTSNEDSISEVLQAPPLGKSDHMVLRFKIPVNLIKDEVVEVRNYFHVDYDKFRGFLNGVDWDTELLDKDGLHSHGSFDETYLEVWNSLFQSVRNTCPEILRDLCGLLRIKQKNKCWKQYIKVKRKGHDCASVKWNTFIRVRNDTVNLIKSSKSIFENKIANEVKVNEKSFWRYVNSQLNTRSGIPTLRNFEGKLVVDNQDKAESFNSFFSNVFCKENQGRVNSSLGEPIQCSES
ncbi:uncharacterized protein [Antedon mediterranea]|uniref:uncharacterized protein n=1 Tax=Antedon mediterranea TaxID=105859 RepID=UPI003AF61B43